MGLFDSLTGNAAFDANNKSRDYLGALQTNLSGASNAAYTGAGDFLRGGVTDARGNLSTGYDAAGNAIRSGSADALGYLGQGTQGALSQLTAGGGAYAPLSALGQRFGQGSQLYADAMGINGAGGNERATSAFHAGPGYDWQVGQGLDAINRSRNSRGMLNSGNTDVDALKYGQGLANQNYQQWLGNLQPYNQLELGATAGAAAGNQTNNTLAASLLSSEGQNKATVAGSEGRSLADLARSYYGSQAGLDTSQAQALGGFGIDNVKNLQQLGLNIAPQFTNTYQKDADASAAASANSLKLGVDLAKLVAGGIGGIGGGGSSFLPSSSFMNNSWGY